MWPNDLPRRRSARRSCGGGRDGAGRESGRGQRRRACGACNRLPHETIFNRMLTSPYPFPPQSKNKRCPGLILCGARVSERNSPRVVGLRLLGLTEEGDALGAPGGERERERARRGMTNLCLRPGSAFRAEDSLRAGVRRVPGCDGVVREASLGCPAALLESSRVSPPHRQ